jgi:hypothetical protein
MPGSLFRAGDGLARCGWSSEDTAALHNVTDRDCVRSTSHCARALPPRSGTIPRPSPVPIVLRLVLGGHSRGPVCVCTLASTADTQLASGHPALTFDRA